ncbi:hypothetical protein AAF712_014787 [Marasmius tenuissimus]|uniref:Uncharacterized protein n=1 Tax=Marasmius tenuissimus TaxID=585030 RepID=A0ABR2ZB57_9AGAR
MGWSLSRAFPGGIARVNLRHLSTLRWIVSDTSVETLLSSFPNLEELALQPSSPVSKTRLLGLKRALRSLHVLKGISIVRSPGPGSRRLSAKDKVKVARVWRDACRTICYVRLDLAVKHVWSEDAQTWLVKQHSPGSFLLPPHMVTEFCEDENVDGAARDAIFF